LEESRLEIVFFISVGGQLIHELHIVGLHISEDNEFLSISEDLHFDKVQIALKLVFYAFEGL